MDVRVLNVLMIFLIRIVGRQHSTVEYKIFNTVPVIALFCKLSWCRGQAARGLEIFLSDQAGSLPVIVNFIVTLMEV